MNKKSNDGLVVELYRSRLTSLLRFQTTSTLLRDSPITVTLKVLLMRDFNLSSVDWSTKCSKPNFSPSTLGAIALHFYFIADSLFFQIQPVIESTICHKHI